MAASITCPLPEVLAFQHAGHQPQSQVDSAAAEIAHQVEGRHRRAVSLSDAVQRPGQGDVVDVVAGGLSQRAVLPPPGHPPVDQTGISGQAVFGPQPQALHDPGPESLDQGVAAGDKLERCLPALPVFQVDGHRSPAPAQQVVAILHQYPQVGLLHPVDAQHLGTHVRQQHGGHGRRSDARELNDPVTRQDSHGSVFAFLSCRQMPSPSTSAAVASG